MSNGRRARIDEALGILRAVGMPAGQLNDRTALVLLALVELRADNPWTAAGSSLRGVTPMMGFIREHYGVDYAPNTRETIRRFSLHQMVQASLATENPDQPTRPVNSPKWCYQVSPAALRLVRAFGTEAWSAELAAFHGGAGQLRERYAQEREMYRLPVQFPDGMMVRDVTLSPGGQNRVVKAVLEEFSPRFTPGARVVYVGDAGEKWAIFDREHLASLGVQVDAHGKMPDVVLNHEAKGWLVLVEAVTSHGPMNPKRIVELRSLFAGATSGLVFVTAFPDRATMARYLSDVAWETEVWVAEAPSHLVHFNGERFLGPY